MKIPQKPKWMMWDHNIHYHPFLLRHIPPGTNTALDVGCGAGVFAEQVAATVPKVVAMDRDTEVIRSAQALSRSPNVEYVEADVMEAELPLASFDFVSCLSALHHMPLRPALDRLRSLVAPGGVLAVLGLYKCATPVDYMHVATTGLIDLGVGLVRHRTQASLRRPQGVVQDWHDTLQEIRHAARSVLPGAIVRRHMYDRYSLVYRRPDTRVPLHPSEVAADGGGPTEDGSPYAGAPVLDRNEPPRKRASGRWSDD